jgi:phosphatidate cytidylyltransferase
MMDARGTVRGVGADITRILSAIVLLPIVLGTVWFLPPLATLALVEIALVIAFVEYANLAARLGAPFPRVISGAAAVACCAALGGWGAETEGVLLAALVALGAVAVGEGRPGPETLRGVAAGLFAPLYLGLPLGAFVAVRTFHGREAVLLLMLVIMTSDTAQYYGGRAFGRRLLAPAISPKKTIAGAVSGIIVGTAVMLGLGWRWLPTFGTFNLLLLGATVVALGIVGDLFESLLKRSAGVKDSSALIPGHGGLLDRIDSWLFAAPAYYVYLHYALT